MLNYISSYQLRERHKRTTFTVANYFHILSSEYRKKSHDERNFKCENFKEYIHLITSYMLCPSARTVAASKAEETSFMISMKV